MERYKVVRHRKPRRHSRPKVPYEINLADGKMRVCSDVTYSWDNSWLVLKVEDKPIGRLPFNTLAKQYNEDSLSFAIDRLVGIIVEKTNCRLETILEVEIRELLARYQPTRKVR